MRTGVGTPVIRESFCFVWGCVAHNSLLNIFLCTARDPEDYSSVEIKLSLRSAPTARIVSCRVHIRNPISLTLAAHVRILGASIMGASVA